MNLQGMCRPLPLHCIAANIQSELCLECKPGFRSQAGVCKVVEPIAILNCASQNGESC